MAEILVSDFCERMFRRSGRRFADKNMRQSKNFARPGAGNGGRAFVFALQPHAGARMSDCSDCSAHWFFHWFSIVLAPAAFLMLAQSFAL